jgi:hypothetical protein
MDLVRRVHTRDLKSAAEIDTGRTILPRLRRPPSPHLPVSPSPHLPPNPHKKIWITPNWL